MIKLNKKYLEKFIKEEELDAYQPFVDKVDELIKKKTGAGNEFLGWYDLPTDYDEEEFKDLILAANKIQDESEILIVIGIGGSYLGAKAVIEMLSHSFANQMPSKKLEIYFAGHNISSTYLAELNEVIGEKDFSINVISKSGTTTEPAIAFRYFKDKLVAKYGAEANTRIYSTTDKENGALKEQANANNWQTFVVPDNIGGRFSVLTAVGLLPIAASGIDIIRLMQGAALAQEKLTKSEIKKNDAYYYAALRNIMLNKGKDIEILVGYDPKLTYFNEWWKQLFGESEGKENKSLFPASVINSTDLHSMGQWIQEGKRNIFETVLKIKTPQTEVKVPAASENLDGLEYLENREISQINDAALNATAIAHVEGGVPNLIIEMEKLTEEEIGYLIYFFELSCACSGYLLGVNPFDQPGVESYKRNMFALLGKPGFEELKKELEDK